MNFDFCIECLQAMNMRVGERESVAQDDNGSEQFNQGYKSEDEDPDDSRRFDEGSYESDAGSGPNQEQAETDFLTCSAGQGPSHWSRFQEPSRSTDRSSSDDDRGGDGQYVTALPVRKRRSAEPSSGDGGRRRRGPGYAGGGGESGGDTERARYEHSPKLLAHKNVRALDQLKCDFESAVAATQVQCQGRWAGGLGNGAGVGVVALHLRAHCPEYARLGGCAIGAGPECLAGSGL